MRPERGKGTNDPPFALSDSGTAAATSSLPWRGETLDLATSPLYGTQAMLH